MTGRSPVRLTSRTLLWGTLAASALLAAGLVLDVAGAAETAATIAAAGVIALLATPALGLITTYWELRSRRPGSAMLALVVLGVLAVATVIALFAAT